MEYISKRKKSIFPSFRISNFKSKVNTVCISDHYLHPLHPSTSSLPFHRHTNVLYKRPTIPSPYKHIHFTMPHALPFPFQQVRNILNFDLQRSSQPLFRSPLKSPPFNASSTNAKALIPPTPSYLHHHALLSSFSAAEKRLKKPPPP